MGVIILGANTLYINFCCNHGVQRVKSPCNVNYNTMLIITQISLDSAHKISTFAQGFDTSNLQKCSPKRCT